MRAEIAVFAIALLVRLVHIWQIRGAPFFAVLIGDAQGYDTWAQEIARGDWMGCGAGGGVSERQALGHFRGGHHRREASNVG